MKTYSIKIYICNYKSKKYNKSINNQVSSGKKSDKPEVQYLTKKRNKSYKGIYISNTEVYVSRLEKILQGR